MSAFSALLSSTVDDHWAEAPLWAQDWSVCIATDAPSASADIRQLLKAPFHPEIADIARGPVGGWGRFDAFVVDAWRKTASDIDAVGALLATLSHLRKPVFLIVGPSMRVMLARSGLLTGVNTCIRPLLRETLPDVMHSLLARAQHPTQLKRQTRAAFLSVPEHQEALVAADEALERIFALGTHGASLEMPVIDGHATTIIGSLAESDIGSWIDGVRLHHDVTYQHCLLVTGIAIAFGQQLGFPRKDLQRIALGALLHDVGKSRIPIGILDKPSALSHEERNLMARHPTYGVELLRREANVSDELKSIVMSHHEYLDGSGYPSGLMALNIPDIVRLITVADIFGALIEKRAYREPLRGEEAYDILLSMEGKLDMAIVKAVRQTAFKARN